MKAYLPSAKRGTYNAANGAEQKPKNEVINEVHPKRKTCGQKRKNGI